MDRPGFCRVEQILGSGLRQVHHTRGVREYLDKRKVSYSMPSRINLTGRLDSEEKVQKKLIFGQPKKRSTKKTTCFTNLVVSFQTKKQHT
jgi:hypothetical protein